MSNDPTAAIQAVFDKLAEVRALHDEAARMLKEVAPLLIGRRIKYGGHIHVIVKPYIGYGNIIALTGTRVNGKREFYCGTLRRAEFVDG